MKRLITFLFAKTILCIVFNLMAVSGYSQCPAPDYIVNQSGCAGEYMLSARTTGINNVKWHVWYKSENGTDSVTTTLQFSPTNGIWISQLTSTFTSSVTYWVASKCGGVVGSSRVQVSFTPQPLTVAITTDPFSFPPVYCADEIDFKASASETSNFNWYKNGQNVSSIDTYNPVEFNSNYDILSVVATTTAGCIATDTLDSIFKIGIPVGAVTINTTAASNRCQGTGTTEFYAVADAAKSFQWSITPGAALSTSTYGSSSFSVNWNPEFTGQATINVTAFGCSNSQSTATSSHFTNPSPAMPATVSLEYCDFEPIYLKGPEGSSAINYDWYDNNDNLLGSGATWKLSAKKVGQYPYKFKAISALGCVSIAFSALNINVTAGCDDKLNWIKSTSFSYTKQNNGSLTQQTVGQSKSYFDLAGELLQSQTKTYSNGGQIFSAKTIKDELDRTVAATLSAPMSQADFQYKHWFVLDQDGDLYDHTDLNNPIGDQEGTLGWYYSENNATSLVAKTGYPLARTEYYIDGTGEVRKAGGPGETMRLGMGHESLSGTFPVFNELDDYLSKRNSILGATPNLSLRNEGVQSIGRDVNGKRENGYENLIVSITDKSGKTVMTARAGTVTDKVLTVINVINSSGDPTSANYRPMTYFYLLEPQQVSITGSSDFVIEDIINDVIKDPGQTFADPANESKWPVGFYRILLTNSQSSIQVSYTNHYLDIAYQFYNDAGRLISSVSPNGTKKWINATTNSLPNPYNEIDKTTYEYNYQGWLLQMKEPDAGVTNYVYRRDGKIRFSQNAEQKTTGRYSYTHYDLLGRPVESGEYIPDGANGVPFTAMTEPGYVTSTIKAELEKTHIQVSWVGVKKDWVKTYYDFEDPQLGTETLLSEAQDFLRGAVSFTENDNTKTWYSYDEMGRVTWMLQKPKKLSIASVPPAEGTIRVFKTNYEYDFLGNVLNTYTAMYLDGALTASSLFYHHYLYDADQRLNEVYTSTDGSNKKLRAKYYYYLHGPLKRIELGDKIQGIDFVYNIHGWLTQINHPDNLQDPGSEGTSNGFRSDAFGMALDYYESSLNGVFTGASNQERDILRRHHLPEAYSIRGLSNDYPQFNGVPTADEALAAPYNKAWPNNSTRSHISKPATDK